MAAAPVSPPTRPASRAAAKAARAPSDHGAGGCVSHAGGKQARLSQPCAQAVLLAGGGGEDCSERQGHEGCACGQHQRVAQGFGQKRQIAQGSQGREPNQPAERRDYRQHQKPTAEREGEA